MINILGINNEKITLIPQGVTEKFKPRSNNDIIPILDKYNLSDKNYILLVGSIEPRKNIKNLNGIEVGNHYDKYNSKNPIVKRIMQGFDANLQALVEQTKAQNIHEIGCGEGYWTLKWATQGINSRGSDFSEIAIKLANENANLSDLTVSFTRKSIYDMNVAQDAATLIAVFTYSYSTDGNSRLCQCFTNHGSCIEEICEFYYFVRFYVVCVIFDNIWHGVCWVTSATYGRKCH